MRCFLILLAAASSVVASPVLVDELRRFAAEDDRDLDEVGDRQLSESGSGSGEVIFPGDDTGDMGFPFPGSTPPAHPGPSRGPGQCSHAALRRGYRIRSEYPPAN